jgi:hypothetical protein
VRRAGRRPALVDVDATVRSTVAALHNDTYSGNDRSMGDSYNESITVHGDEESLFLQPLGMSTHLRGSRDGRWTEEGAAEYYLIRRDMCEEAGTARTLHVGSL